MHCWKLSNWPNFTYDRSTLDELIREVTDTLRPLLKTVVELPTEDKHRYLLEVMIEEAKNTSSIEGEFMSREDIYSSIINHRRVGYPTLNVKDKRAVGVGRLTNMLASTFDLPLTEATIKHWHGVLLNGNTSLRSIGDYRLGPDPMRIVSGPQNNLTVHYEAPPAEQVAAEMSVFIEYLSKRQADDPLVHALLLAGITHIHFESIHPFEDGNGRIGRAIIDHILSNALEMPVPFSVSQALQLRQQEYYQALGSARKDLDATEWMRFFLEVLVKSIDLAKDYVTFTLQKAAMLDNIQNSISANQKKVLLKLFDKGPNGFDGGLSAKNYMSITRTSRATATRDLAELVDLGVLNRTGAGRSTRYELNLSNTPRT